MAEPNPLEAHRPAGPGPRWHYLLVVALAGLIVFWRLGAPVMEDHEAKLAITARTMAEPDLWLLPGDQPYEIPPNTTLNHWLVPVENGRPRLVKTPLPYWLVAGLSRLCGGVTDWTARLPSALAAVLCAVVTLAIGRRMFSPRAALLGAVFLATCIAFQKWGRIARPEMLLTLLMTAAMGCFWCGLESRNRRARAAWMIAFWLVMGLANLSKQFVPLLLAWPLAAFLFWREHAGEGDDESALRRLRSFLIATEIGLGLHLVLTNPWGQVVTLFVSLPAGGLLVWRLLSRGPQPADGRRIARALLAGVAVAAAVQIAAWVLLSWALAAAEQMAVVQGRATFVVMALGLGVPMLWYLLRCRGWRQIWPLLQTALPGAAVMLAMFVPWLWTMSGMFPGLAGSALSEQVTDRAAGVAIGDLYGPDVYVVGLITFTLPWLAFLPGGLAVGLMRRFADRRGGLVYLLLWALGLLILFAAAAGKREHYILPMIPAVCLLMGFVAEDVVGRHRWITPTQAGLIGGGYLVTAAVGTAGLAVAVLVTGGQWRLVHMLAVVAVAGVPMAAGGVLAWRGRLRALVPLVAASITLIYVVFYSFHELWDPRLPAQDFARQAARVVPRGDPVYHWHDPWLKIPYYFGRYVPAVQWQFLRARQSPNEPIDARVREFIESGQAPWMFAYAGNRATLEPLGYRMVLGRQGRQRRKLHYALFHRAGPASQPATRPTGHTDGDEGQR